MNCTNKRFIFRLSVLGWQHSNHFEKYIWVPFYLKGIQNCMHKQFAKHDLVLLNDHVQSNLSLMFYLLDVSFWLYWTFSSLYLQQKYINDRVFLDSNIQNIHDKYWFWMTTTNPWSFFVFIFSMMDNYVWSIKFFTFIHIFVWWWMITSNPLSFLYVSFLMTDDYIQSIKFLYLSFLMMDGYIQSIKFFPFIFLMIWMSTSN